MRVGKEVLATRPGRRRNHMASCEQDGADAGSCRWPDDDMGALAKRAIRVSRSVRVKVRKLDSSTKNQQEGEDCNEQNTTEGIRRPNFVIARHIEPSL